MGEIPVNSMAFNGERLKIARIYRDLTATELADKLGVKRQTISMYENGKLINPEIEKIHDMSRILDFPMNFFLEKSSDDVKIAPSTYFRSLLTTNKKYRLEQETRIGIICRIYAFINDYIEFPTLNLPHYNQYDSPEEAAYVLRQHWGLSDKPIDNLVYLVEQNGLIVTSYNTSTSAIDAFSQSLEIQGEERYVIAFSKNKTTAARIHFDIAHELGHILMHGWSEDLETLSPDEFRNREMEANAFAAAFLLPKESFIRDVGVYAGNLKYYEVLKQKWKVSMSAMIMRSKNLGLIDYDKYQMMMRRMQKLGIRKTEPLDDVLITAQPSILKTAVEMLINGNVLTAREFMMELSNDYGISLYPYDVEELLDLKKGTLNISDNIIPVHDLNLKKGD